MTGAIKFSPHADHSKLETSGLDRAVFLCSESMSKQQKKTKIDKRAAALRENLKKRKSPSKSNAKDKEKSAEKQDNE